MGHTLFSSTPTTSTAFSCPTNKLKGRRRKKKEEKGKERRKKKGEENKHTFFPLLLSTIKQEGS
jgi:hypothetical protein